MAGEISAAKARLRHMPALSGNPGLAADWAALEEFSTAENAG